jgi:putative peptidoglycan lipid II flippase
LTGTLLSRLSGLGRDVAMAFCFGSAPAIAAFMVAFRFAYLLRRLFGEGLLSPAFIPHFEALRRESAEQSGALYRDLCASLAFLLLCVIGVAEGLLWGWLRWGDMPPGAADIVRLTLLMLPGVFFLCLYALASAVLQCDRRFFLCAAAPALFNGVWVAAAWMLRRQPPSAAACGLSWAVSGGLLVQWLVTVPGTFRLLKGRCVLFSPAVRALARPLLYGALGLGAVQINNALDGVFARFASLEGPAYLWYAIRLEQAPLALFGVAVASALLPALSRATLAESRAELLAFAWKRTLRVIVPCTAALFALGAAALNLVYGRGAFGEEQLVQTVWCLWSYGVGLVPAVCVLVLAPAFYAQKDYKTPLRASLHAVALNVILNALMVFVLDWGPYSVALATSCCALYNCFYLSRKVRIADTGWLKTAACSAIAAVGTLVLGHYLVGDPSLALMLGLEVSVPLARGFGAQLLHFCALGGVFGLLFVSYAWMTGTEGVLGLRRGS